MSANYTPDKKSEKKARPKYPPKRSKLRNTEKDTKERISNDPNWYFTNSEMANQVSDFSFNQFLGVPFTLGNKVPAEVKLGSVSAIWMNPSAGWTDITNPSMAGINMNGVKTFSMLSARNSKTTQYAPQDVICLELALGSIIEYVEWIRRLFGVAFTYNVRNRAYAQSVIESMGINFSDFISKLADYRNQANTIINMFNQVPFPDNLTYFEKCRSLYQDIYLDSQVNMAQSYVPCPYSLWTIDEQYDENGTGLVTTLVFGTPGEKTLAFHLSQLRTMIQAMLNSTTLNYIYSDILSFNDKRGGKLLKMDMISSSYSVMPRYSENFLLQLNNATIVGVPLAKSAQFDDGMHVTKDNDVKSDASRNCILYTPQFVEDYPVMGIDAILNFKTDTPDVTMRIEASRLTVRGEATLNPADSKYYSSFLTLPDHYIVRITVATIGSAVTVYFSKAGGAYTQQMYEHVSRFGGWPIMYRFANSGFANIFGDVDYFTTVDSNYLRAIDDMTFMGLFELR